MRTESGFRCDGWDCRETWTYTIAGIRYHCSECENADFCETCRSRPIGPHHDGHKTSQHSMPLHPAQKPDKQSEKPIESELESGDDSAAPIPGSNPLEIIDLASESLAKLEGSKHDTPARRQAFERLELKPSSRPRFAYRVEYPTSQSKWTSESLDAAVDISKRVLFWTLPVVVRRHLTWNTEFPTPLLSLFRRREDAESWAQDRAKETETKGDCVILKVDLSGLDTIYEPHRLISKLKIDVSQAKCEPEKELLVLNRIPSNAIISTLDIAAPVIIIPEPTNEQQSQSSQPTILARQIGPVSVTSAAFKTFPLEIPRLDVDASVIINGGPEYLGGLPEALTRLLEREATVPLLALVDVGYYENLRFWARKILGSKYTELLQSSLYVKMDESETPMRPEGDLKDVSPPVESSKGQNGIDDSS